MIIDFSYTFIGTTLELYPQTKWQTPLTRSVIIRNMSIRVSETKAMVSLPKDRKTKLLLGKQCGRCKDIDFQAIFNISQSIPPLNGLPLLDLERLFVGCPVCSLFANICYRTPNPRRRVIYHLRAFSSHAVLGESRVKGSKIKCFIRCCCRASSSPRAV